MYDIVGIGAAVYDTLLVTSSFPTEDTKCRVREILYSGGGPCATGLVAAAKLGASCGYIGILSDDTGSKFLYGDFSKYGVDTRHLTIEKGFRSFSSYILLNEEKSTRTCVVDRGNLPALHMDTEQENAVKQAKILMVDGNELPAALYAAEYARKSGTKVLYDAGGLYEGIDKLLPLTDILIPSEEFALGFTGEKDVQSAAQKLYHAYHPEMIVITQGSHGGILYDGTQWKTYPAFAVDAVDSNGAGDVFHGAFAFAQVQGLDSAERCIFASAASALKCTKLGARTAAPTYDEVINFLRRNGYGSIEENMEHARRHR